MKTSVPSSDQQSKHPSHPFRIAIVAIFLSVASAYLSFVVAILSLNEAVILIFLWVNALCFVATIILLFLHRYGMAFLLTVTPVPLGFVTSFVYMYFRNQ